MSHQRLYPGENARSESDDISSRFSDSIAARAKMRLHMLDQEARQAALNEFEKKPQLKILSNLNSARASQRRENRSEIDKGKLRRLKSAYISRYKGKWYVKLLEDFVQQSDKLCNEIKYVVENEKQQIQELRSKIEELERSLISRRARASSSSRYETANVLDNACVDDITQDASSTSGSNDYRADPAATTASIVTSESERFAGMTFEDAEDIDKQLQEHLQKEKASRAGTANPLMDYLPCSGTESTQGASFQQFDSLPKDMEALIDDVMTQSLSQTWRLQQGANVPHRLGAMSKKNSSVWGTAYASGDVLRGALLFKIRYVHYS